MIAALYVQTGGCYFGLPDVDPWDEPRDARLYAGPWPVVAHPPCARWGRYWFGGPLRIARGYPPMVLGDDGGCFAAALAAVRTWGGVIEHPEVSRAWDRHGIRRPPRSGGWVRADLVGGWTCCVEQGHYGHRARKPTWLYCRGIRRPPQLSWGQSSVTGKIDMGAHSREERKAKSRRFTEIEMMGRRERAATPPTFRDLLLSLARGATL